MPFPTIRRVCVLLCLAGCATVVVEDPTEGAPPRPVDAPDPASTCAALGVELDTGDGSSGIDVFGAADGPGCSAFVVGSYFGEPRVAGAAVRSGAVWTGWVAHFRPDGGLSWFRDLGSAEPDNNATVHHVIGDAAGNVWVAGRSEGALTASGSVILEGTGDYVLALDSEGQVRWADRLAGWPTHGVLRSDSTVSYFLEAAGGVDEVRFDSASGTRTTRRVVNGDFGLMASATRAEMTLLAGCTMTEFWSGSHRFARRDPTPDGQGNPTCDLALLTLGAAGEARWLRTFEEQGFSPYLAFVASEVGGDVALAASFWGKIDLGDGLREASSIGEGMRLLVARFDGGGGLRESGVFGDAAFSFPAGIAAAPGGAFDLGGTIYDGSIDLGDRTIESADLAYAGFRASLDASGGIAASHPEPGLEGVFESGIGAPFVAIRRMSADGRDLGLTVKRPVTGGR